MSVSAFLVARFSWDACNWGSGLAESIPYQAFFETETWEGHRMVPVSIVHTRRAAESLARSLSLEARHARSPFWFAESWESLTSRSSQLFDQLVRDHVGLLPPTYNEDDPYSFNVFAAYATWWEENSPTWTDDERREVWDLFDNLRFYDVTEILLED